MPKPLIEKIALGQARYRPCSLGRPHRFAERRPRDRREGRETRVCKFGFVLRCRAWGSEILGKERTARELFRVLKPGGELHVADWGRPTNALMRGLFFSIQLLDGFGNTRDNVAGKLIALFEQAGFVQVAQRRTFGTIYGTLALYSAVKPG